MVDLTTTHDAKTIITILKMRKMRYREIWFGDLDIKALMKDFQISWLWEKKKYERTRETQKQKLERDFVGIQA